MGLAEWWGDWTSGGGGVDASQGGIPSGSFGGWSGGGGTILPGSTGGGGGVVEQIKAEVGRWITSGIALLGRQVGGAGTSPGELEKFARLVYPVLAAKASVTGLDTMCYWFGELLMVHPGGSWEKAGVYPTWAEAEVAVNSWAASRHFLFMRADSVSFKNLTDPAVLAGLVSWTEYGAASGGWSWDDFGLGPKAPEGPTRPTVNPSTAGLGGLGGSAALALLIGLVLVVPYLARGRK